MGTDTVNFIGVCPHFSKKETGTGLGLAIVKKVIESYGGSITVESRYINEYPDNHSTTFTIRLPAVNISAPAAGAPLFFHPEVSHPFFLHIVEQDL